jgi:predicted acylesterase/phospholipase RssA
MSPRPWLGSVLLAVAIVGCAESRAARPTEVLLDERRAQDERFFREAKDVIGRMVAYVKAERDAWEAGLRPEPPTFDVLVLSGGGDLGAFGVGFLRGWGRVRGPLARPRFTAVTGVSTGALIAPFAFLGDEGSLDILESLYRNPQPDWVRRRQPIWFLPSNASFATVPGLEREVKAYMSLERVSRIADAGSGGRMLILNTTNADDGGPRAWDMVAESDRAVITGDLERVHDILLASAGIPGVFPHRTIDGAMYVDGGVTGNIIHGARLREEQTHVAVWKAAYPGIPVPKTRYWVIWNNQVRGIPQVVEATWPAIFTRSIDIAIRSATLTSIRQLFAQAEILRLKHAAEVEVRFVAIPDEWVAPKPGVFVKENMNALADLGARMGADPRSWISEPYLGERLR